MVALENNMTLQLFNIQYSLYHFLFASVLQLQSFVLLNLEVACSSPSSVHCFSFTPQIDCTLSVSCLEYVMIIEPVKFKDSLYLYNGQFCVFT